MQTARDHLEEASTYLHHARDNFGEGREWAIKATADTIREFEALEAEPKLQPNPETKKLANLGKHDHPKMTMGLDELDAANDQLNGSACRDDARLDALRAKVADAISATRAAIASRPP